MGIGPRAEAVGCKLAEYTAARQQVEALPLNPPFSGPPKHITQPSVGAGANGSRLYTVKKEVF